MMGDGMKGPVGGTKAYLKLFTCILIVIWTVVVGISLYHDLSLVNESVMKVALYQAEAHFNKDQAIRFWSTKHGGVYVEVDERTPPNPYLAHLSNRDITINNDKTLTLMNPAYMIRQMNEEFSELYGVVGHITSLKPLRPENAPDDWERAALVSFGKGAEERSEVSIINGNPYLRFMRPMLTREGCLKCHGHQGYKVGDVRGGVGVAVPLKPLYVLAADQSRTLIVWHSVILCLGISIIALGFVQLSRRDKARMEAEIALRLSEERFRTVADFSYDWETWIRPDGSYEYVSPSCEHITGYSRDEFLNNQNLFLDIIYPDDRETFIEHTKLHFSPDDGKAEFIGRIITKTGEIRWIWHKCQSVFREDGVWSGRRVSNRDITDLRQAENDLRVSEERLNIALQNRELGLWDWDIESGKVLFNQCWGDMLGYSLDEIESSISTWKGLIHPGDAAIFSKKIEDHFLGKSTLYEAEYRLLAKSGQWVWVLDKGKVVEWDSKGKPLRAIGTQLDITARRKQVTRDKEMIRQREHMRRIESLEVMAAAIAHRFNNAMTAVQGNLELMKMTLPDESAEKEMAIRALGAARGASRVGSMMLTYVGQGRPIFPAADLFILVQKTVVDMKSEFPSSITLHFTPAEGPLLCPMDQKQIREVVLTVLTNAIEAMEGIEGAIEITFGIESCQSSSFPLMFREDIPGASRYAFCQIKDSGSGIDPHEVDRIFEPFYTTKFVGRGLGLAMAAGIMRSHRGALTVTSDPGEGAAVKILLPVATALGNKQVQEEKQEDDGMKYSGMVLFADDDNNVLDTGEKILEKCGFTVVTAVDGEDAVNKVFELGTSLKAVILDVSMPKKDGIEAMNEIRKKYENIPVLLVSGYSEKDLPLDNISVGQSYGFLQKPFQISDMKSSLWKILSL